MVRLLPDMDEEFRLLAEEFQSHNGAIAAFLQFHFLQPFAVVSIPQWCDCCRLITAQLAKFP